METSFQLLIIVVLALVGFVVAASVPIHLHR